MITALLGAVVCMLCIGLGTPSWGLGAIFGFQILMGMSSPGTFAISQILAGPSAAGRWVGIQNAIANLAGVIAPALTGVLVEETHHFAAAFVCAALVSVLGLIGWVWMVPKVAPLQWQAGSAAAPLAPLPGTTS
jgi:MFS family permease